MEPPAKRRKYRVIHEEEDEAEAIAEHNQRWDTVRPSERYDVFDFLRFCDSEDDQSLLPEMRDFARRLGVTHWAMLSKAQLCEEIRRRVSLLDLPMDKLAVISNFLPPAARSILRGTSQLSKELLPAVTHTQQLIDRFGGRVFQILFGMETFDVSVDEFSAAAELVDTDNAFFNEHDLNTIPANVTHAPPLGAQPWMIEFVPGIVRQVLPAVPHTLQGEENRQLAENPHIPVRIPLVRIQTTNDHGRDTVEAALLTVGRDGSRSIVHYTLPPTVQEYPKQEYKSRARDRNYLESGAEYHVRHGWFVLVHHERMPLPFLSFESECCIHRRSLIARVYMDAIVWANTYEKQHPEWHPVLATLPRPAVGTTFWSSKAREERAVDALDGYNVVTGGGRRVRLPLRSWVTLVTNKRPYMTIANWMHEQVRGGGGAPQTTNDDDNESRSTIDPIVLRRMTPINLHEDIFLPLQREVQKWWIQNVNAEAPAPPPAKRVAAVPFALMPA